MSEPLVSVLVCTIRETPRLKLTLDCLSNQTYKNFELIYVDAIKDKRAEEFGLLMDEYRKKFSIKHVQDKPWSGLGKKPGLSNARNTGILYCSGDIIVVTGDNTWFSEEWIQRHVNLINNGYVSVSPCYNVSHPIEAQHKKGTLIKHDSYPASIIVSLEGETTELFEAPLDCRLPGLPDHLVFGNEQFLQVPGGYLHGVSFALTLERWLNVNGMDEEYDKNGYGFEDCDFGMRLHVMGFKIALDPANWVVSINDEKNPTLNKMFGTSGEANNVLWNDTINYARPIWSNGNFNLRKVREKLKWYQSK